jgi:hypothetical protein
VLDGARRDSVLCACAGKLIRNATWRLVMRGPEMQRPPHARRRLSGGRFAKLYFALGLMMPGYILDLWVKLPVPSGPTTPNIPGGVMRFMHPPLLLNGIELVTNRGRCQALFSLFSDKLRVTPDDKAPQYSDDPNRTQAAALDATRRDTASRACAGKSSRTASCER